VQWYPSIIVGQIPTLKFITADICQNYWSFYGQLWH